MADTILTRDNLDFLLKSQPKSTTLPLKEEDIDRYKVLFKQALCVQDPAVRQIFIALSGKIIKRVPDSLRVVLRDQKQYTDDDRELILERYKSFIKWLIKFCFDSLYCNAYFGSYTLIMSTLKLVITHISSPIFYKSVIPALPVEDLLHERQCHDSILSCLNDSFEENKALALELLFKLPINSDIMNAKSLRLFEDIAYQLVASVNPAHSLTCQYVFKMCVELEAKQTGLSRNKLLLDKLNSLSDLVDKGIRETQENFVLALKYNAIYPKLTCIRALLSDIDMSHIEDDREGWRALAKRIVVASIDACKAVSTIVCNLNPETIGHLPMDQKPIDAGTLSRLLQLSPNVTQDDMNTITSQLLLISGWKTIKECSLSLGSLCTRLWWPEGGLTKKGQEFPGSVTSKSILDSDDVIQIILFFDHYLKNLRHRGAFEQAYNGFIMVTRRIWNDEQFKKMLVEILTQILNDFRDDAIDSHKADYLKAYVTRRSAGLPFIVQAILISEKPQETETLELVMNCLYEILESVNSETYQKIHCLNILNGLTKEANLGDKMMRYVGKTFAIVLDSLASYDFPIRNCANMLLKATVDRTFGTNRSKYTIHSKNSMTFGKFFLECPDLLAKMVGHLKRGLGKTNVSFAAIHGVFIILSRLRPNLAPSDEFKPTEELVGPFIEPLIELSRKCEDLKITEIAMQLLTRLDRILSPDSEFIVGEEGLLKPWTQLRGDNGEFVHQILFQKNILYELYQSKTDLEDYKPSDTEKTWMLSRIARYHETCDFCMDYNFSYFLINQILELMEKCAILAPESERLQKDVLKFSCEVLSPFVHPEESSQNDYIERARSDPLFEDCIFKSLILATRREMNLDMFSYICNGIAQIMPGSRWRSNELPTYSDSLKGALLRYMRQRVHVSSKYIYPPCLSQLMNELDIDSTATFCTPIDRINNPQNTGQERQQLERFFGSEGCRRDELECDLLGKLDLFNISRFKEFQRSPTSGRYSLKMSNTLKAIELIALSWHVLQESYTRRLDHNIDDLKIRMKLSRDLVHDLPDCDIKCLVLLDCGRLIRETSERHNKVSCVEFSADLYDYMVDLTQIFDTHSDGNHSNLIRESICNAVKEAWAGYRDKSSSLAKQWENREKQLTFASNLFSALIKLSQDDDHKIRDSCHDFIWVNMCDAIAGVRKLDLRTAHPLESLILLATKEFFNYPDSSGEPLNLDIESNACFKLLMKIIFNHSKSYSISATLDKEGLFDKTMLNTFADHVATTSAVLECLKNIFHSKRIDLEKLTFSADILAEFQEVAKGSGETNASNDAGDYGWRKKMINEDAGKCATKQDDNNQLVSGFLERIVRSLDYFAKGYRSMLIDTGYTYHELSLYKRMAFIAFVCCCTNHKIENMRDAVDEIREKLEMITKNSCATTLLVKTLDLTKNIQFG